MSTSFGNALKEHRIARQLTLREFCAKANIDAGNFSRIERGISPPPSDQKIEEFGRILELEEDRVQDLLDKAAVCRGRIPEDILGDAELAAQLPLLFRTVRGSRPTDEQLTGIAKQLRKR